MAKPEYLANEVVWFDDALPAGAVIGAPFNWSTAQAASGTQSDYVSTNDTHFFDRATSTLPLYMWDVIVVYVLIDPCNPPRELMLQFNDGTDWSRRAYWGENLVDAGNAGTPQRRRLGPMPEGGKWVRLEVPVSAMEMQGMALKGISFGVVDGKAWFDRVGKAPRVNLALGKPTSMSSWLRSDGVRETTEPNPCTYNCSKFLVDNDTYSFPHTGNAPREWVQVDLGAVQPIESIDLFNSGLNWCCFDRLQNFWILVSDVPMPTDLNAAIAQAGVGAYYYQPQALRPSTFEIRRTGRYIRVQLDGTNYLHPGDMYVWAPLTPSKQNLSAGAHVSQSSLYEVRYPELASNANTNGVFNAESSVNHTQGGVEEWWSVDLGSIQAISSLDLWGRLDYAPHFPKNFYVFVSNEPLTSTSVTTTLADPKVSAYYYGTPAQTGVIPIPINRSGRYLRVQYTTDSQFAINFAEVWVWSAMPALGTTEKPVAGTTNTPPVFPVHLRSQIVVVSNTNGDFVTGPAGAVTDPDTPIRITVTNTRTGQRSTAIAAADGSFSVPVTGNPGDSFTVRATDSHPYSLSSESIAVNGVLTQQVTQLNSSSWNVDSSFRARTVARDGKTLVVTGAGGGTGTGDSDRLVQFDLTNPAAPSFVRTVSAGNTAIYDVELANGWAYVASFDFCTLNIASTTSSKLCHGTIGAMTVALMNQYAFVATNTNYNIRVYDVTIPASPRFVREQAMMNAAGMFFWDLISLGNGYLAGASFWNDNGVDHDLVIIDARDVNSFAKVADIDIPNFQAVRGRVEGSTLYLSSTSGEVAAIDVSNPAAPVILSRTPVGGVSPNSRPVGNDLLAAAATAGLAQVDVTSPASPFLIKNIVVGGVAQDIVAYSNYAYVANDVGLAVVRLPLAPQIEASRITLARESPNVVVRGTATAITGATPITVTVTNRTSGATAPGFAVASDGSFTASIAASAGDRIAITAFDTAARSTKLFDLGSVPFGTAVFTNILGPSSSYRARTVRTDGTYLVVAKWAGEGESGTNNQIGVFDISADPAAPLYKYFIVNATEGSSYGFDVKGGWAFLGGYDFCTVNLAVETFARRCVALPFSDNTAVVSGNYAFTAVNWHANDGRIRVYDVSNPGSPSFRREQSMLGANGGEFYDLQLLGTQYLVAISPNGHDVVVIDRSNIDSLVKIADIDIPGFDPFRGHLEGNLLILSAWSGDKIAIVDLANPASPVVRKVLATGVLNHAVTGYANRAIVAGSMLGALYLDTTTPANPRPLGLQFTGGNAWDVLYRNGVLYVATEQGLVVIPNANPQP